jgi:FtsZ-binding cell division protein ZapB
MTEKKVSSIEDAEKAIEEHRLNPRRIKRDAPNEFREWVKGHNVGLKIALEILRELKANLFSHSANGVLTEKALPKADEKIVLKDDEIKSIKELRKAIREWVQNGGIVREDVKSLSNIIDSFEASVRERIKWLLGQADAYRQFPLIEEPNAVWREDEAIALYWMLTGKEIHVKELRRVLEGGFGQAFPQKRLLGASK